MHDWADSYVVQILKNQVVALRQGARIVLNEICLPEPNTLNKYQGQFLRGYDLSMKHLFNGKERDEDEWRRLFAEADKRFLVTKIISPRHSILSVIEVLWNGPTMFET